MRKIHKSNVIFRVALILLCLVLFSAHLSSGMLAKYTISGDGSNAARIASAKVTVTPAAAAPVIKADGSASYAFTVKNTAEVSYTYSLLIYVDSSVALTQEQLAKAFGSPKLIIPEIEPVPSASTQPDSDPIELSFDAAQNAYVYECTAAFEPGDTADYTLLFRADDVVATANVAEDVKVYDSVKINIAAKAVQLD